MAESSEQVRLRIPAPLPLWLTNDYILQPSQTPQSPDRSRVTVGDIGKVLRLSEPAEAWSLEPHVTYADLLPA